MAGPVCVQLQITSSWERRAGAADGWREVFVTGLQKSQRRRRSRKTNTDWSFASLSEFRKQKPHDGAVEFIANHMN